MTPEEQLKEDQWNARIDAQFKNQRHLMIGVILAVIGQILTALLLHKWN